MAVSTSTGMTRRRFLANAAALLAPATLGGLGFPYPSRAADRPLVTHGVQSGDVSMDSGVVWARTDRPARMLLEVAATESFKHVRHAVYIDALPESDHTAKALVEGLPPGQEIFYRIRFQDLDRGAFGDAIVGRFRTAPADARSVSFLWSGDTAGQGWGIDQARGGMRTYKIMRENRPDFFVHCGDNIYANCPITAERALPDGTLWKNTTSEEKSTVAQTLAQYRGNYKYNLLDTHLRAFNAEVPTFAQWDNHEVMEDWWPGEPLDSRDYLARNALLLAARGRRAFHEFIPIRQNLAEPGRIYRKIAYGPLLDVFMVDTRSYRSSNAQWHEGPANLLGSAQVAWLKHELKMSRATWKVIASAAPLGLVGNGATEEPPAGREIEIGNLLAFIKHAGIDNVVWITAELHYTAAHYYDPNKAAFQDFKPFWEFVSGPIHAGTWRPTALDRTFGPTVIFQKASSDELGDDLAPCFGLQFFGHVAIEGSSGVMTVTLKDVENRALWSTTLEPADSAVTLSPQNFDSVG
jgi:alkaline phosphatase D